MTDEQLLPTDYTLGRPSSEIENELAALVSTCDIADVGVTDVDVGDIREWLGSPSTSPERDGWVVTDADDRLVAWVYIESWYRERSENARVYIHPDAPTHGLVPPLTDLLVRRAAERAAEDAEPDKLLEFFLSRSDVDLAGELERRGSAPERTLAQMRRVLDGSEGRVAVPAGIAVHDGVDPADDTLMRAFHSVVGAAFGDLNTTAYDAWRDHLAASPTIP